MQSVSGFHFVLEAPPHFEAHEIGESVAVNGCCLTLVGTGSGLHFDLSEETLKRTSLGKLRSQMHVNLERSATLSTLFGGHIVQGHVDGTATVLAIGQREGSSVYRFGIHDPASARYLIDKGSITLDGISLTVVEPSGAEFEAWIIPHTLRNTNLGDRAVGDVVNVEYDVIAKHVEKLLACREPS